MIYADTGPQKTHRGRSADDDAEVGLPHELLNLVHMPWPLSKPDNTWSCERAAFIAFRQVPDIYVWLGLVLREYVLGASQSGTDGGVEVVFSMCTVRRRAHDVEEPAVHLEGGVLHLWRSNLVRTLGELLGDSLECPAAQAVDVLRDEREGGARGNVLPQSRDRKHGKRMVPMVWLGCQDSAKMRLRIGQAGGHCEDEDPYFSLR